MTESTYPFQQKRWSLADLFPAPNSPELEAAFVQVKQMASDFTQVREQLTPDIPSADFLALARRYEELSDLLYRMNSYAGLAFAEDTQNQATLALMARVEQFTADITNETLFFSLWWKMLDDANAERLMAVSGDYRYWLEEMRHFKPHTLSEAEEKIINIKDVTGANALRTLYDTITNRYVFELEVNGERRELTRGELTSLVRQHDPELRAAAYQKLYEVYGKDGPVLGQIYQTLVRDWRNEGLGLRGYAQPISVRNLANDIPDEVVDTLLEVAQRNVGIFQRFFRLKARLLGMERLRRYDVYAPIARSDKQYPFGQAAEMVFDSFRQFDPRLEELARRVFEQDHLDSEVRKGKRGGAFCASTSPRLTPWVLVNYQQRADDVATLAHELGHAIHSMMAADHSLFTFHSCLPLAETASTFGEMMLMDRLLAQETDPAVRRDILFRQVDDAYATIQRQAFFCLFERQAHEMINEGASVDDLSEAYLAALRAQFGDAVEVSDEFRWEWVSIPHIYHTPFYVYAYAFGQLLVFALYQQFKVEGESFKPRYLKILATGGSKAPVEILAEAGIDVRQAAFWQGGFDVIDALVRQLEAELA
ncbi:MAG: M3 family oligoendopeptidase [Anaerolinea sp.]|nr:M3 family oligoendopeptidase [Anaerolinea sp.]